MKNMYGSDIMWFRRHLINKSGSVCGICKKEIRLMGDITVDHITPISKGGLSVLANLQLAHRLCNQRKGSDGTA